MNNHSPHHTSSTSTSGIDQTQITELLTRSTEQLDDAIVFALRKARREALQKQHIHEPVFLLSTMGHRAHHLIPHSTPQWIAAAVLFATIVLGTIAFWQKTQIPVDIKILTDDMPIEVFVEQ